MISLQKTKVLTELKQSYRTNANKSSIQVDKSRVKLPRLGWVKFAKSREIEGKILSATIRRTPTGKYFISILCEAEIQQLPVINNQVGVDLGIKDFVITSDGEVFANPKHYRKYESKLKRLQQRLSKKQKGSSNRNRARLKVVSLSAALQQEKLFLVLF